MIANDGIREFMEKTLDVYDQIRGKHRNDFDHKFWDAVVFSSCDLSQKAAYEKQISEKQQCLEIPLGIPFHIFSDPENCKIGCGGSTMLIVEKLTEIYGNELQSMHILFVPAGGYSQRLPNYSVLGKLFAPVPVGNEAYEMVDLILAVYLPFLKRMKPGIFIASSDAIISFCLNEQDEWSFEHSGFTALSHPSTVAIGENHGVYVLPSVLQNEGNSFMSSCIQVLQKPSKSLMERTGAIVKYLDEGGGKEFVFTDSAFFFDMDVAMKLLNFYKKVKPLSCELSAYGDFLQPLGSDANCSYIGSSHSHLSNLKKQLFEVLHGTPLSVLVLKNSAFFHFGTMHEYVWNYSVESLFSKHFPYKNIIHSRFLAKENLLNSVNGTVLFSVLHPDCIVNIYSLVEYCDISIPVHIHNNCVLSHCRVSKSSLLDFPLKIPENLLFHTVSLKKGYVTVCFGLDDDIKKTCKKSDISSLSFLNLKLDYLLKKFIIHKIFDDEDEFVSLWHAKLFPISSDMETSFLKTLSFIYTLLGMHEITNEFITQSKNSHFISMKEILKYKNEEELLNYRKKIIENTA